MMEDATVSHTSHGLELLLTPITAAPQIFYLFAQLALTRLRPPEPEPPPCFLTGSSSAPASRPLRRPQSPVSRGTTHVPVDPVRRQPRHWLARRGASPCQLPQRRYRFLYRSLFPSSD